MPSTRTLLRHATVLSLAAGLLAAGCAGPEAARSGAAATSTLPPVVSPPDNLSTPEKVALGAQLFIDTRLSGSGKLACQSCHYRYLGWADNQVLSRKDDGVLNTRHTPSLYNVGYQSLWYWDGRAATLEGQVLAAWRGQTGADPVKVSAALNTVPGYRTQFEAVFGGPASPETVSKALAAFLRSLTSSGSPWDRYEAGARGEVSADAIEGQKLFAGKGRCVACHTPPWYGNSTFYDIGLEDGKPKPDLGRFTVTKDEGDRYTFKTPSLRSTALSGPYFHDGSAATLEQAVRYMANGGGSSPRKSAALVATGLSDAEVNKVVAFLKSLSSDEPWVPPTLP